MPGGVGGAQGRRLGDLGTHHVHAELVGLELHQHLVGHHAAVDLEFGQLVPGVRVHRLQTSRVW
jgi:hypothetical protein